jgi:NADPH:quinone reductase-like Zn-dependent oxidoreductase
MDSAAGAVPETMTAIDPAGPGGPEVLVAVQRPVPRPRPGEVLISVEAAGVNRPDILQRRGRSITAAAISSPR